MFYKALKCRCLHRHFLLCPPPHCTIATSIRKKRQVIVVGNSLLRGTEGSVHWTDTPLTEVCTLLGAWVKDITRKIPSLAQPSDYDPFLLFHVGGNEATIPPLRAVMLMYISLSLGLVSYTDVSLPQEG